ncbi:excinuclease ABC subunit C, partial [Escherichia coli]|nr:excinuclease ABC subunit C [Escherichia coli]
RLVRQIRDLELIITTSEKEALLLEMILIQKYQPPFNIQLKEGTSYPYIKITNEKNPHIEVVFEVKRDGAHYFG